MEPAYTDQKGFADQLDLIQVKGELLQTTMHRSIGAIISIDSYERYTFGSGILISKDMFLTAAHNVYNKMSSTENKNFKIYFADLDGITKVCYLTDGVKYLEEFTTCDESKKTPFDFALVKLKKEVQYNDFLKISLGCSQCLWANNSQKFVQIFGFPKHKQNYTSVKYGGINLRQYGFTRKNEIKQIDSSQHKLCYRIRTQPGHSGSPVVVDNKIIAIHVGAGNSQQQFNIGRMVDLPIFIQLEDWRRQLNGCPFQICSKDLCTHLRPIVEEYLEREQWERKKKQTTTKLELKEKQIKEIKVSEYTNLADLCLNNNKLSAIDVTQNTKLTRLYLYNNQLSAIDVTQNTYLTILFLNNNQLSAIDVTQNTNLTILFLNNNQLSAIDVTQNTYLTILFLNNNQLSAIDVTQNTNLTILFLNNNQLSAIDVTQNTYLTILFLNNNQLSAIDVTQNTNLTILFLNNNQLSAIDVTQNTNLADLDLSNNQLSAIDVTQNTNLADLDLSNNQLSAIDVTQNTNLTILYLSNNQLSAIDVTQNTNLADLRLNNNQLSAIDVTQNTNLTRLQLSINKLSAIDVTQNTKLTRLYLYNNQLSAIDVTQNTNLTDLRLNNNQLSAIDVTQNTKLNSFRFQINRLKTVSLSFNPSKPIEQYLRSDYLGHLYFNFCDQFSSVCEIQIHYNSADKSKCSELKEQWAKNYNKNNHKCKYAILAIEQ